MHRKNAQSTKLIHRLGRQRIDLLFFLETFKEKNTFFKKQKEKMAYHKTKLRIVEVFYL